MALYNNVNIEGRISNDIEVRKTQQGTSVARFSVAVNRPYQKDKETQVDFIPCQAWRGTAEFLERNFKKGDPIKIVGHIQVSNYTDKDDNKRTSFGVVVDELGFVIGAARRDNNSQPTGNPAPNYADGPNQNQATQQTQATETNQVPDFDEIVDDDDDLPF